jgi:hypothetical protein
LQQQQGSSTLAAVRLKAAAADSHWFSHMYMMHGRHPCLHPVQL